MVSFTILPEDEPGPSREQFVEYRRQAPADLVMGVGVVKVTVRRYVRQATLSVEPPGTPLVWYDGITEP